MRKNTKLAVGLILSAVIASGAYAQEDSYKGSSSMGEGKKMMMKKGMHKKSQRGFMSLLKDINLSEEQKEQISQIKKDMMKEKVSPDVAFTKDGFDKAKFIEIMKQKRENMIESKAEMIHRVYKILTSKQKEQLKTLIQLKKEKKMALKMSMMNK